MSKIKKNKAASTETLSPVAAAEKLATAIIKNAHSKGTDRLITELKPFKTVDSVEYATLMLTQRPSASFGAEQDGMNLETANGQSQRYEKVSALFGKQHSQQPITDEVTRDSNVNLESELVSLCGEEFTMNVADDLLFGDATKTNGVQRLRGLLNTRIDSENGHAEALKDDSERHQDYFQCVKTGLSGSFGSDYSTVRAYFSKLKKSLPVKYRSRAKFYMNSETLESLEAFESAGGNSLVKYLGGDAFILGHPVVLIEQMPNESEGAASVMFGCLADALRLLKLSNNVTAADYSVVDKTTVKGVKVVYLSSRFGEIMSNNDALRIGLLTA